MTDQLPTIRTADGRTLEYLQIGPADGPVVLFHLGTPNAAAEYSVISDAAAALGLRVISYSRPGYGESTERPGRRVADAVGDVTELLDQLGVAAFRSFGWSGGGPHALACAALLPGRCQAAATLAGVAPYPARGIDFMDGMGQENVAEFGAALAGREQLTDYLEPLLEHFSQLTGDTVAEGLDTVLSGVDRAALTGLFADQTAAAMRRAVAHGIAGWRDDDLAFVQDWGFELSRIELPVAIWQGRQDQMVPFAHGQWLAAEIPTAQAHLYADEGHLSLIVQAERILTDLMLA
ncbi:MAG TPA: alpha/beta hydrolase [Jatrophihabitans sp.]|jgi:pimeloyl-ACP methyl ester carboxylesterase|nr:alpha/beta hydrolase [Jatrophihabitans sp.]